MKKLITILLSIMMCFSVIACTKPDNGGNGGNNGGNSGNGGNDTTKIELIKNQTYYDEVGDIDALGMETASNYTKKLFYRNNVPFTCADPFAFRCEDITDTENYGKFFLYGTTNVGVFNCFSSTDLISWTPKLGAYEWQNEGWEKADCWAPEVAWDKDADPADYGLEDDGIGQGVYFFFYSASSWVGYMPSNQRVLGLAVGTSPYGPFKMYNGDEYGAKIGGVDYSTEAGYSNFQAAHDVDTARGRVGDVISMDDPWFNDSAARASLTFQWENRENAGNWVDPEGNVVDENTPDATYIPENAAYMITDEGKGYITCIDPHPYVDPVTKQKYLYFSLSGGSRVGVDENGLMIWQGQQVYVVEMLNNDWSQIDYSSLTRCTRGTINVISQAAADAYQEDADNFDASAYPLGHKEGDLNLTVKQAEAECRMSTAGVNEGPFVLYNKDTGLYYMTISVAGYTDSSYSLVQLTAYRPTGPWRKLDLDEGAVVLSTDVGRAMDNVFGPGHHSFVQVGDELINVYHKHINYAESVHNRGPAADRVHWVKNNQGMTVLHTNGPTTAIQPNFYGTGSTEYDNIISDATITTSANTERNLDALSDGVIKIHTDDIDGHLKEYEFEDAQNVITLKFDDYKAITGLMIYNSRFTDSTFLDIAKIELDAKMNGKEFTAYINNLQMYWDKYTFADGYTILPGSSAVAVFNELAVKEIRITVNNINDESLGYSGYTAISDIVVLGKPDYTPNTTGDGSGNVNITNFNNENVKTYSTYGDFTIDGNITEEEWGTYSKYSTILNVGGVDNEIEISMAFTEKGLVTYWQVLGAPAFYNPDRDMHNNSGVEIYLAPGDATSTQGIAWQIELFYTGNYGSTKWVQYGNGTHNGYTTCASFVDCYGQVDGIPNDPTNNGYIIEAFIPWVTFGLTEAPESMMMDGAVMYCPTYNGKREAWVSLAANKRPAYSWENPQAWYRFDSEGWVDDENFDGHWVYTGYEKDVIISDDDKVVEIFNTEDAWNYPSPRFVQANGIYENSVYHQAKFFAPSIYNSELIEYETNPNEETVLSGLWISRGGRIQLDLQYNQGGWYLRFSGPWWTNISLTEAQADLLKNKDKGLTVGLYVEGDTAIAYLDDGTGLMEQAIVLDITSKSNGYDKTKLFTAGVHAQCDSIIKDHLIFGNIVNVPYVINDGEPLVGGNVQVTGTMASSKVTVIPSAGYALDQLIINGKEVNTLVYNSTAPILNIQVSFKEVVGQQVAVTVKGGFAYEQAKTLNGVAVTFTDGTDSYFGIVDATGKASITLPAGSYTVKAIGYTDATIVIDSETAYEITLNRIIVDNIDYGTVIPSTNILYDNGGVDGANILYDGGIKNPDNPKGDADEARFTLNQGLDLSGPVVVSYTMKVATRIRAFIPIEFNKSYMCNFGIWDSSTIVIKKYNQDPSISTVGKISTDYGVQCVSIGITAIIDGSNAIMLYTDGEGNTHYIDTLTNNTPITSINFRFADFGGVMAIEDLKVYDGQSAQNIVDDYGASITVGEKGNSTVTCDNSIDFTESKNITIVPDTDYQITSVKINGEEVDCTIDNDGSTVINIKHFDISCKSYVVTVSTKLSRETSATFTVTTAKAYTTPVAVPDGTVVDIKGYAANYKGTVSNGKVVIDAILTGDYKLSIAGYVSATISVDEDGFDGNVTLMYAIIDTTSHVDASSIGEGKLQFLNKSTDAVEFKDTNIKFLSIRVVDKIDTKAHVLDNTSDIGGTKIWFTNGTDKSNFETQYLGPNATYGGNGVSPYYRVRFQMSWEFCDISKTLQDNLVDDTKGLTLAVAITDSAVYGLFKDESGNWVVAKNFTRFGGPYHILGVCSEFGLSTVYDLYYSDTVPAEVASLLV